MRWYYGWNVLAVGVLFQALIVGICFTCFTFWVDPWVQEFGVGRRDVMMAIAASTIGTGILMPFAGRLMDKVPMRILICGGTVVLGVGVVLIAHATALWQIVALYATLIAFGYAFAATLAGQALAAKWFPSRIGFAVGIVSLGSSLGGVVMPPVCTFLLQHYGWRDANMMLAALVVAIVVPVVWLVARLPREGELEAPRVHQHAAPVAAAPRGEWTTARVFGDRIFWVLGLTFLGPAIAYYGFQQNLAPFSAELGFEPQAAAALVSVFSAATIAGRFLFGVMADRTDPRIPYWIASACIGLSLVVTPFHPAYPVMLAASALIGLGSSGLMPVVCVMVGQNYGSAAFGRVMGLVIPFFSVAAAAGPVLSGAVRDELGSYIYAFVLYLPPMIVAGLAMLVMMRRPAAEVAPAADPARIAA
jgi:MFS family permease